jgi:hypothetical protein
MKVRGRRQWVLVTAFMLVVIVTALSAMRTVRRAIYWSHHRDEPIRSWMTLRYVAHSYDVSPGMLYEALGIPHPPHDRRPILEIAREQKVPVAVVMKTIQQAIENAHPANPPPTISSERGKSR